MRAFQAFVLAPPCAKGAPSRVLLSFFLTAGFLTSGCGGDALTIVPVKGQVALTTGKWPRPGMIFFAPVEPAAGFPRMPGMGDVDVDGNFRVTTQPNRDGLVPGKYRVHLEIWKVPPTMGGPSSSSAVPGKYQQAATSGLEVVVPADASEPLVVRWEISPDP